MTTAGLWEGQFERGVKPLFRSPLSNIVEPVVSISGGRRLWGVVVVLATVALTGLVARAVADDVEAIVKRGVELRKEGKDREALAEFQRAAQIDRTPHVVGQMGLAEVAMGIWPAAQEHIQEALDHGKDPWVGKNRVVLETTLAIVETHLGTLEIWGTPSGAELVVDGKPVGTLPQAKPVHVVVGAVTVTVQAKGYQSVSRTLQVISEQLTRENVDLAPLPKPSVDLAVKDAQPPTGPPSLSGDHPANGGTLVGQGAALVADTPAENQPLVKRWWFWTVVGVVLVGGVVGAVTLLGSKDESPGCPMGVTCLPH